MTHDPLCPTQTMCKCKDQECWDCREAPPPCQCDLIATVRADERAKWTHVCPDNNCCHHGRTRAGARLSH